MTKAYSLDLRERVIAAVDGGASRRETAERFEVSVSAAIKWVQRWNATGSAAAKPQGGSRSPLEEHATWLLDLIAAQPDLTLDEVVAAMGKQRITGSRTAVWRFFERHGISFKKNFARQRAGAA
jgi:transposase